MTTRSSSTPAGTAPAGAPRRIRWRRFDGPLPAGAKLVTRPGRYGNPYPVCEHRTRQQAVEQFEQLLSTRTTAPDTRCPCMDRPRMRDPLEYPTDEQIRADLAGHDLACACDHAGPCHGDVLLRLANREVS